MTKYKSIITAQEGMYCATMGDNGFEISKIVAYGITGNGQPVALKLGFDGGFSAVEKYSEAETNLVFFSEKELIEEVKSITVHEMLILKDFYCVHKGIDVGIDEEIDKLLSTDIKTAYELVDALDNLYILKDKAAYELGRDITDLNNLAEIY